MINATKVIFILSNNYYLPNSLAELVGMKPLSYGMNYIRKVISERELGASRII